MPKFLAVVVCALLLTLLGVVPACTSKRDCLHFPPDSTVGFVEVKGDWDEVWTCRDGEEYRWKSIGPARGDVFVPAGEKVAILLSEDIGDNLSALAQLATVPIQTILVQSHDGDVLRNLPVMPNLEGLCFKGYENEELPFEELRKFPHLSTLTGVNIKTLAQWKIVAQLPCLRRLSSVYARSDDMSVPGKPAHIEELTCSVRTPKSLATLVDVQSISDLCLNIDTGDLELLPTIKNLNRLSMRGTQLDTEAYRCIAACKSLKQLELLDFKPAAAGLAALSESTSLESIRINDRPLADEDLAELAKLRSLKRVALACMTRPGEHIDNINNVDMGKLGALNNLEELTLGYGSMSAASAKGIAALPRLRILQLPCKTACDALPAIAESKSIAVLHLCGGSMEGLLSLKKMKTLKSLDYMGKISEELNANLRTALPELIVQHEGPHEIPGAGRVLWDAFRQDLRSHNWRSALSYCTDEVQRQAAEYKNEEEFFRDTLPIDDVVALDNPVIFGSSFFERRNCLSHNFRVKFGEVNRQFPETSQPFPVEWCGSFWHTDTQWLIHFEPTSLSVLIEKAKDYARECDNKEQEGTRLFKGISIKLTCTKETYGVGEPVLFRLDLINEGDYWIYCDSQGTLQGGLGVIDAEAKPIKYLKPPCQTFGGGKPLAPGKSDCIYENRNIAEWYDLSKPGKYTVQLSTLALRMYADPSGEPAKFSDRGGVYLPRKTVGAPSGLTSNVVSIQILPKQP